MREQKHQASEYRNCLSEQKNQVYSERICVSERKNWVSEQKELYVSEGRNIDSSKMTGSENRVTGSGSGVLRWMVCGANTQTAIYETLFNSSFTGYL